MANLPTTAPTAGRSLQASQVYGMAAVCLVVGLGLGYLARGSQPPVSPAQAVARAEGPSLPASPTGAGHAPTLSELKSLADRQAAPLLEKLKGDPNNSSLLVQTGGIYHSRHQFKEAAAYYGKAVQADPKNVPLRSKLATSLYRSGDVDGAIAQLNQALSYDPGDANSLFNLGLIRLQGKGDGKGAVAAWQRLLKSNPHLSEDRKAEVQKLMADVLTTLGDRQGAKGGQGK